MSGRQKNWAVPFCRQLQGLWIPGQSLFIQGFIIGDQSVRPGGNNGACLQLRDWYRNVNCMVFPWSVLIIDSLVRIFLAFKAFDINLAVGQNAYDADPKDDIALHMSNRLKGSEGKVVLNDFHSGQWGQKEQRFACPFKKGEEFDVRIRAHEQHFEVFANGKLLGAFEYRHALSKVTFVCIYGDVELHRVSWEGRYYPMPFQTLLTEGFGVGKVLYASGVVDERASKFSVNFLTAKGDNAFHFNPRFDEKKVVRNSQENGVWQGQEEREGEFPFARGRVFDIIIQSQSDAYYVFVNGQPCCSYKHRLPLGDVKGLAIDGDVELQGVHW